MDAEHCGCAVLGELKSTETRWLLARQLRTSTIATCSPADPNRQIAPCSHFHPRMMLVLLLYAYSAGVFSSRKIMQQCATDAAFRIIVGEDIPNFRRIAEFRARHLKHLQALFLEVLVLCREAGLLKVGRLSLDGTKIKANASRNKAMSYDRGRASPGSGLVFGVQAEGCFDLC